MIMISVTKHVLKIKTSYRPRTEKMKLRASNIIVTVAVKRGASQLVFEVNINVFCLSKILNHQPVLSLFLEEIIII